jgi:hypothetical protein
MRFIKNDPAALAAYIEALGQGLVVSSFKNPFYGLTVSPGARP